MLFAGAASAPLPAAVRSFVERRMDCAHWMGEEPYDAGRRAEIDRAMTRLRCATLDRDEARLRRRFAGRADVQAALDALPVL